MYAVAEIIVKKRVPYGWILKVGILLFVFTAIQCSANYWKIDIDFHEEDINREQGVTLTVSPGFISARTSTALNNDWHQIISDSTVPIDAEVKAENGNSIFIYDTLLPGDSFYFQSQEPCVVTIVAS
jgi:hypothetical protein